MSGFQLPVNFIEDPEQLLRITRCHQVPLKVHLELESIPGKRHHTTTQGSYGSKDDL
jgi:hypothetical protein